MNLELDELIKIKVLLEIEMNRQKDMFNHRTLKIYALKEYENLNNIVTKINYIIKKNY